MTEKQFTLDGRLVPVARHRDDIVECSDGTSCARHEALFDVAGCAHRDDEDKFEANVELVRDILERVVEWSDEYHTGNSDYPNSYGYIVNEVSHEWPKRIEEWIRTQCGDYYGRTKYDGYMDDMVKYIRENLDGSFDCEPEYSANEYSAYSGVDCCLFSLDIGECEEQIDVNSYPELKVLHDSGELDDVLDELDCDFCISRTYRRVRNEETGYYENVGRKTYNPHGSDCPAFYVYTMPGGQWHYVVSADRMNELICEYLDDYDE